MTNVFSLQKVNEYHYQLVISTDEQHHLADDKISILEDVIFQINSLPNVKVVELIGTKKYFSAGAAINSLIECDINLIISAAAKVPENILKIKPVTIGNMLGHAIGGGLALGLWTDLPCLCESSLYGVNFLTLGFTPGMGATSILESNFGIPLAHQMLLTGKLFNGKKLKEAACPISNRIFPSEHYDMKLKQLIKELIGIKREPLLLLKETLAKRKIENAIKITNEELQMHNICFNDKSTLDTIKDNYLNKFIDKDSEL